MTIIIGALLDFLIGDPENFFHPIRLMGKIIRFEEKCARKISNSRRALRTMGFLIAIFNILIGFLVPYVIIKILPHPFDLIFGSYIAFTTLCTKNLKDESLMVVSEMEQSIDRGRAWLSRIVGRDTKKLDKKGILKATIETIAENTSDGIIAPLFYMLLLGPSGGMMYKFVNTMDSSLGYKNERYIDLGRYPAIIDDIFNFIPSRLTAILFAIQGIIIGRAGDAFRIIIRDGKKHLSPNAGYPESAMAGLLGITLGGGNYYGGNYVFKETLGDDVYDIEPSMVRRAIRFMYGAEIIVLIIVIVRFI